MILSFFVAFGAGLLGAAFLLFVSKTVIAQRLYSLECDVADLQDRHLSTVRRAAAAKRWELDEGIEEKIGKLTEQPAAPDKKEGWTKWGSSKSSS